MHREYKYKEDPKIFKCKENINTKKYPKVSIYIFMALVRAGLSTNGSYDICLNISE
jgi:hypothetical protein